MKKKYKTNKPLKVSSPFDEIWIDINDIDYPEQTKSYERFRLENPNDQIFILNGNIYIIDKRCIERLYGYNPMLELVSGFKKIKEILSFKKIGFLDFKNEQGTDNVIFPINRETVFSMIQPVKPTPALLKVLTLNTKYQHFIRSLPDENKTKIQLKGKWIFIVIIAIVAIVLGLFFGGIITPEMLGVPTNT